MKNADMPAMPVAVKANEQEKAFGVADVQFQGLTKREMFAMHAMQGFASSDVETTRVYLKASGEDDIGVMFAKMSVEFADALLAELDK